MSRAAESWTTCHSNAPNVEKYSGKAYSAYKTRHYGTVSLLSLSVSPSVDHRGEREHSCPNTDLGDVSVCHTCSQKHSVTIFHQSFTIICTQTRAVVCPLCNKVIVRSRHQPLNDQVERHILSGCKDLVAVEPKERKRANRCTYKNCRRRELLPFVCPQCERVYCLGHRHALDHECRGAAMAVPRTVAVH